jgi:hypothetical protein
VEDDSVGDLVDAPPLSEFWSDDSVDVWLDNQGW